MKKRSLIVTMAVFLGCASHADKIEGVSNETELNKRYDDFDTKRDMKKGTSKQAMESVGLSEKDLAEGKVSCDDIDKKTRSKFATAKEKSAEQRRVDLARDVSNELLGCKFDSLK